MRNYYLLRVSVLLIALFISNNISAININAGGTISANTTWSADTVKITSDIIVNSGISLTVSAGTYVEAQGSYAINVQGRIVANGTKDNKITFTAKSQGVGWKGIRYYNTPSTNSTSVFKYCNFTYGKNTSGSLNDKMGGAFFVYNFAKIIIKNSVFVNNYAQYGGAIALRTNSNIEIYNCLIANNSASSLGGGMFIFGSSNPTLTNLTIANNTASKGGGMYASSLSGEVRNCIIYSNSASTYSQIYGTPSNLSYCNVEGGFNTGTSNVDVDPNFAAPTASAGNSYDGLAADYSIISSSPMIDQGTITSNSSMGNFDAAGNFRFDNSIPDIGAYEYITSTEVCGTISSNTTWSGNILINCDILVNNGVTLTVQPGTKIISTGHHEFVIKGRLLAQGLSSDYITFTAWDKNIGWQGLTFVSVSSSNDTSKVEYCKISNKVYTNTGNSYGAIYVNNSNKVLLRNNIIANNKGKYGGGISVYNSSIKIVGNLIGHNEAISYGAGIRLSIDASKITNNTIVANKNVNGSSSGAGIYLSGANSTVLKNNIIYFNSDNTLAVSAAKNISSTTGTSIQYSCIQGGIAGTGNISSNPLFKTASSVIGRSKDIFNYNYSLKEISPAIDAGAASTVGLNLPSTDLVGKVRNFSASIDMGAYEDKSALAVCGNITSDEVWDANTININCDVTIPNGVTVSIAKGTKVKFNGHYKIDVKGALQARGTVSDSIFFSAADVNVGWDGLRFENVSGSNDSSYFKYCSFKYAKRVPSNNMQSGGAISARASYELSINNCRFMYNEAAGTYGNGAAFSIVYMYGNRDGRNFSNNTFKYNTAKYGVVQLYYSNLNFKDNVFTNNTITHGTVFKATTIGGDIDNNFVANNSCSSGAVQLGGVSNYYDTYFTNNIIVNNSGSSCGGIFMWGSKAFIYNNTIANNFSTDVSKAAGLYFYENSDANLKNNIIYGNEITGGVRAQVYIRSVNADPKFYNNNIEGGRVAFTGAGAGINYTGVFNDNIDVSPGFTAPSADAGNSYSGSAADWSLAQGSNLINAGFKNSSSLPIPSTDYNKNSRIFNGRIDVGAIENQESIVSPCIISSDLEWEADTIKITCDVTIQSSKKLTIKPGTNVLFMGHYEINVEGAIVAEGTPTKNINFLVNDTTGFYDSLTTNGSWNGFNFNSVVPVINDSSKFDYCNFSFAKTVNSGSSSQTSGAVLYIYNSPNISVKNSKFSNNRARFMGGAVFVESSNIVFNNNVLSNNIAGYAGGGISLDDCTMDFINNTVVNNKANMYGGMQVSGSEVTIKNSLFWGNDVWNTYYHTNKRFSQLGFSQSNSSKVYNSNFQYGSTKVYGYNTINVFQNNLDLDPQFENPSAGTGPLFDGLAADWNIGTNTPLLNKGLNLVGIPLYDIAGNPRKVSDTIDIGAYEVQISSRFINLQPVANSVCVGSDGTFSAHASVNAQYQWQKDGNNIAGANSYLLNKNTVTLADSGSYNCIISNAFGTISTDTVLFTIMVEPSITQSPTAANACLGSSVSFTSDADGTNPLTYKWYNTNGLLSTIVGSTASQGVEIGTDTIRNTPNNYPSPFANYYHGAKHQFIVLASELTAMGVVAGDISSLSFDVNSLNACPSLSNFEIKIGSTALNAVSNSWFTGLSSVYSVGSFQPTAGWNSFGFINAYDWDGTSNIVIEVCSNNASWVNNGNASVNQSNTSFYSTLYYRADNSSVCSTPGNGTKLMVRPNIKLNAQTAVASTSSTYSINSISTNDASNYYMVASNICGSDQSSGAILGIKYKPTITAIPATENICEDASVSYVATSQGTSPITYQWYKDGGEIAGSVNLSYSITSANASAAGIYYCKATNICGYDSTNQSVLTVDEKPSISSQSSSQTVCENQSVSIYVTATGTAPITYQWYDGGSPISGATNNSYTISSVSTSDAGTYYCKISNGCTSTPITSTGISLTVNESPAISSQTSNIDICGGTAASFSVTVSGTAPLSYQWYDASGSIASATNNTYSIGSVSTSDAGNYYCIATNSCGTASSNQIPLTVNSSPSIATQPIALTKCEGQSALIDIQASGTATLNYQWYKGGSQISGATSQSYLISPVALSDAANYYCKVTNSCGNVSSNSVALTVNSNVSITAQSSSQTICEGVSPTLSVTTSGTTPITYQWYNDDGSIAGAVNSSYSMTSIDTSDAGGYYCIATNTCTNTTSNSIVLSINQAPTVTNQPASTIVCENLSAVFNVSASGTSPMAYQWYNSGGSISGATASSYIIPQAALSDVGSYYVKASNICGNITSNTASLAVNTGVSISSQTSSSTECSGASPSFSITASGTSPISYQWYNDNTAIASATNNSYGLTNIDTSDIAAYYVIATNMCNSVQSNVMNLAVEQAPSFNTQPSDVAVCSGSSAQLSTSVSGSTPLSYQWYKSSATIAGATNTSYIISQTSTTDAGSFYIKASNSCGEITSNTANLTVNTGVSISSQTSSTTECSGASPSFSITATGTSPISYQWYNDNTAIASATNNSYGLTNIDTSDIAAYYVTASNMCNSIQSNVMNLAVEQAPSFNTQPSDITVCSGSSAQLSASVSGSATLSYQWYKSSAAISGATNTSYIISQVSSTDAGSFYIKASNSCGEITSNTAALTVNNGVSISSQTSSTTECTGASPSFSITATGTSPISYQWYNDNTAIASATNNSYGLTNIDTSDIAAYYVIATNMCNSIQSNVMNLAVEQGPSFNTQPSDITVCSGSSAQLSASVSGSATLSYQWYKSSAAISGATNTSYIISQVSSTDAGSFYIKASNTCGEITSNTAALTVNNGVSISSQTSSTTECTGASPSFSITATGTSPISYQWYNDNTAIASATNNSYGLTNIDTSDIAGYYVIATNMCNSIQSNVMNLAVDQSPTINTQPLNAIVCNGSSAQLSVSASGSAPLSYQWYKASTAMNGVTNSLYLISQTVSSDAASYYVEVSNSCGSVSSNNASLTVNDAPSILSQSAGLTECEGNSALFTISANGTSPLVYQWYTDTGMVAGANANSYTIPAVSTANAANYNCVVSNSCGSVSSSNKLLTVNTAPTIISQSTNDTICEGISSVMQIGVTGTNPMTYQWYKTANPIVAAQSSYYTIPSIDTNDAATYYAIVTNTCGTDQSNDIDITVNQLAQIVFQSADSSRCEYESMSFDVTTVGTSPLVYQWYKGVSAISGAQSSNYGIDTVVLSDAGYYHVNVSNMCNTTSSNYKQLSVHENPIVTLGNDTTFCDGGSVTYAAGFGLQSMWSNGSFNNQINVTSTGSYFVNVSNQYGCSGVSDTVNVTVLYPYASQTICVVGVDTATNKNIIVWDKAVTGSIASFNLYKESTVSNVWNLIGTQDYDSLSVFVDIASNPDIKADRYAISVVDSCGNESAKSPAHRTMHLTVNAGQSLSEWNLIWNSYEGFTPATYMIYRADSSLNYVKIDSLAGSSTFTYLWTDHNAPLNTPVHYMVEIIHPNGGCSPSKVNTNYNSSRSNRVNSTSTNSATTLSPDFIADKTTGNAPIIIHFYDQTTNGAVDTWFWNFGDGKTSDVQDPVHQYDSAGVFHVALTVTNANGSQSIVKSNFIDILPNGVVNIYEALELNVFPNPYKGSTNIVYNLTTESKVSIQVFSSLGKLVADVVNENQYSGSYKYSFNAKDYGFGSGVYFLRMTVGDKVITKRLVQVK